MLRHQAPCRSLRGKVAAAHALRSRYQLGDREFPLQEGENTLGRHPGIAVPVAFAGVSRHHARIVVRGGEAVLEDLGSKNGTFVGEERVLSPRPRRHGDVVGLGKRARLVYRTAAGELTESEG